jgi:DNA-binding MarR family transcriptional regulator
MSIRRDLPIEVTHEVRSRCLCLHIQQSARAIARRFDEAFRPFELTSGQFSLLISLNRPNAPRISEVASLLAMDRTTLTANLKPLERRGLVEIVVDSGDRRGRRLQLTDSGRDLLALTVPVWRSTHAEVDRLLPDADPERLRRELRALTSGTSAASGKHRRRKDGVSTRRAKEPT